GILTFYNFPLRKLSKKFPLFFPRQRCGKPPYPWGLNQTETIQRRSHYLRWSGPSVTTCSLNFPNDKKHTANCYSEAQQCKDTKPNISVYCRSTGANKSR